MKPLYELVDLKKDFVEGHVRVPALNGIHLDIQSGEWVSLVGPSGSGKSTLLNVLGLIEQPTAGNLRFDGQLLGELTETARTALRRRSVGFVFQNFNLIPVLSALENVLYPLLLIGVSRAEAVEKGRKALEEMSLLRFAGHRPAQLSGGQRQRVAIARALVKQPKVILADEPTANLDSRTASEILSLFHELREKRGATLILATHDDKAARQGDRVVTIQDGKIARVDSQPGLAA